MNRSLTGPSWTVSPGLVRVTIDVAEAGVSQGRCWSVGDPGPTAADIPPAAALTAAEPAPSITGEAAIRRLAAALSGDASDSADLCGAAEHVAGALGRLYQDDTTGAIPAATMDLVNALRDTPATASSPPAAGAGAAGMTDRPRAIRTTFGTMLGDAARVAAVAGRDGGAAGVDV